MTMSDTAVEFEGVSKVYRLYPGIGAQVANRLGLRKSGEKDVKSFPALADINLRVGRGERIGLVGRNGAGKTTLLKLLLGHIKPTEGKITVNGSVQAMIHTKKQGFHMHFTGRENIIAALTYNGLNKEEMAETMADIEEFTELGDYLDQPMKNYSLGMQSRLQFAVSSAVNPDILVVDEMLGAGDTYFMAKSAHRMQRLIDRGCTLLLVSHNTQQVLQFCERAVWLRSGRLFMDGPVRDIVNSYDVYIERETERRHAGLPPSELTDARSPVDPEEAKKEFLTKLDDGKEVFRWPGKKGVKVKAIDFSVNGKPSRTARPGDSAVIDLTLAIGKDGDYACRYLVTVWTTKGTRVARIENDSDQFTGKAGTERRIRIDLTPLLLGREEYSFSFSIYDMKDYSSTAHGRDVRYDMIAHGLDFEVASLPEDDRKPAVFLKGDWQLTEPSAKVPAVSI